MTESNKKENIKKKSKIYPSINNILFIIYYFLLFIFTIIDLLYISILLNVWMDYHYLL